MKKSPAPMRLASAAALALCYTFGALAFSPPQLEPLPNFDARSESAFAPVPPPALAEAELQARVPGVRIERTTIGAGSKFITAPRGFLTGPGGQGSAVPAARASAFAADDPHRGVKAFLDEHRALFGHGADALAAAKLQRDETHGRLRTMVWQQQLDGILVFEAIVKAHSTVDGELVNIGGNFVPDPTKAASEAAPNRAALLAAPAVSAAQAVVIAAGNLGESIQIANVVAMSEAAGAVQRRTFRAPKVLDVSAEYVWFPFDAATLRLCWQVVLVSKSRGGEMFKLLVDVETGAVLLRHALTNYLTDASYRVHTSDSPSPFSPGHPTPLSVQPSTVARALVTTPAFNTTASPNGWIDDGGNETRGNNVDAHTDLDANNSPDLPRPQGSPHRVFDFPMDLAQPPGTYTDAAVTQLFYLCNWIHDRFYELGFTEAAGNFQNDNFDRGGLGNDAVQADAQDGSGTNNANFGTPADGSPGRMQMYVFTGPTPDRDGDFDAEIVVHEYTHGLSNRLVGGGVGISQLQTAGMGEGWGDFYGASLLSEPGDDLAGAYAMGGYATYLLTGMTTNYYFGIRRYPYSTDMTKNPLTLKDIDPTKASPHLGVPLSPRYSSSNANPSQVHAQGEVWCATLWECRANLVVKHGHAVGNQLMLQLVTDGMKLAPANATFLQMRDAILQADLVLTGSANFDELWAGFAKRGMGASAIVPPTTTTTGVFEAFDIPDDLSISPLGGATASGMVTGPFTEASYTLVNTAGVPLTWTAARTQPWLELSSYGGTLAPGAQVVLTLSMNAAAGALLPGVHVDTIVFTNVNNGVLQQRTMTLTVQAYTEPFFYDGFESGTLNPAWWTSTGTANFRTQVSTANGPQAGTRHLVMDASVSGTLSRNELTLTADLTGRQNVLLRFGAKMFNDEPHGPPTSPFTTGANFDGVAMSLDGVTWYEVRGLRDLSAAYATYSIDLDAAVAARGWTYNSAFRIRFNHYDDFPVATDGFAFDEITLAAAFANRLLVNVPATATEGGAPLSGTVSVPTAPTSNLTILLSSTDPSELTVPASTLILAGQTTSAAFPITIVDDADLDGTQTVGIIADNLGYAKGMKPIAVADNESAALSVTIPPATTEGASFVTGTVTLSAPAGADVAVELVSSDPTELQVPATTIVRAGETSAIFPITPVEDSLIDGAQTVTVTAQVAGWTDGDATIVVNDNEALVLAVTLPVQVLEGSPVSGSVSVTGSVLAPLIVDLVSDNPTQISVPATVTINTGASSATFAVTAVNDTATDGTQSATVTASAAGFASGSDTVNAIDNEVHHFLVGTIASPQIRNAAFLSTITARNIDDLTITNFNSTVNFTAAGNEGPVPITPASGAGFVSGVRTGNLTATAFGTGVVLTVSDGAGHTGTSNPFDIGIGAVDHFGWAAVPTPQTNNIAFPVTVTALDVGNNVVPTFTDIAALNCGAPSRITGTGTSTWDFPLHTFYHDARTQCIYLASEIGGAGRITSLALNVTALPAQTMNAWTIRMKHTALASYAPAAWESTGWTTVHSSAANVTATGWFVFPLTTPFDYNGTSNLMIDFSFNNSSFTASGASRTTSTSPTVRAIYYFTDSGFGNPLTWSGTTPPPLSATQLPKLRLGLLRNVTMTPTVTGNFTAGVWNGSVAVNQGATNVTLGAESGGAAGESNVFTVLSPPVLSVTPTTDLAASGPSGGPFTPAATTYVVRNAGGGSLTWTATKTAPWLTLSSAGGTLNPSGAVNVTVSFHTDANTLDVGTHSDVLTFTNTANGSGNTTRNVALTVQPKPMLGVTPGGFTTAGPVGGPFTPGSAEYTVSNTGTAPVEWTASNIEPWLTLSPTNGLLPVGASTTVTATVNAAAAALPIGTFTDTLTFTNTSNGAGNTTRAVGLSVLVPPPVLAAEPPFTGGAPGVNAIAWSGVTGATTYEAQRATAPDFSDAVGSGLLAGLNHTFAGLGEGTQYRYRVRGRQTPAGAGAVWVQTTPADFAADVRSNVFLTATGEVVLASNAGTPITGQIGNPSFEGGTLNNWTTIASTGLAARSTNGAGFAPMPTAGTYYCGLNTAHNTLRTAGESVRITQNVDLTGAGVLLFDALLDAPVGSTWAGNVRAEVRIDGAVVWSASTEAAFLDQSVDVSGYTGTHTIELREEVIVTGTFNAQWVYFDNVRLATAGYAAAGAIVTPAIAPAPWQRWHALTFTSLTPGGTALTVDVLAANGALLAADVPSGTDLNSLPAVASLPAIKLRGNLSTTSSSATPRLDDWSIAYQAQPDFLGAWSNVEVSTQDALAPVIVVGSNATANTGITGTYVDVSGLGSLLIDGLPATSFGGGTFTASAAALSSGANTVSFSAADNATPANTVSGSTSVFLATMAGDQDADRLPDAWEVENGLDLFSAAGDHGALGDLDHDGIFNLLEFALGLRANVADAAGLPTVTVEINSSDSLPYLVFHHRRLLAPGSLTYGVEHSSDVQTWTLGTSADFEVAAPPTPVDASTEIVHLRFKPSLTTPGHVRQQVRLRVTAP